jgi:hypothetical protein
MSLLFLHILLAEILTIFLQVNYLFKEYLCSEQLWKIKTVFSLGTSVQQMCLFSTIIKINSV